MSKNSTSTSVKYYREALKVAHEDLNPSNPVMLATVLNMTIMMSEMQGDRVTAAEITQMVIKKAEEFIADFTDEYDFTDSLSCLQILTENLKLWKEEQSEKMDEYIQNQKKTTSSLKSNSMLSESIETESEKNKEADVKVN
jgi:hypothetical protein